MMKKKLSTIAVAVAIATLTACSSNETKVSEADELKSRNEALVAKNESLLAEKEAALKAKQAKEAELAEKDQQLQTVQASLEEANSQAVVAPQSDLLPPDAKPGECYARVWIEPQYKTVTDTLLLKEASSYIEVIPAQYETVTEEVLVSEASSYLEAVPATYSTMSEEKLVEEGGVDWRIKNSVNAALADQALLDKASAYGIDLDGTQPGTCYHEHQTPAQFETVTEEVLLKEAYDVVEPKAAEYRWVEKEVLVSEASSKIENVPAVYETVTEEVIDVPAHTVWKKGTGPIQKIDEATGEIMCLVEVPATYKTVSKQVLVSPATTREVEIPAVYKTVKVRELVADASEIRSTVPAVYDTVNITKKVAEADFVWHEVHDMSMSKESRTGKMICLVEKPARYETVTTTVVATPATTREVVIPEEYQTVQVKKVVSPETTREIEIPAEYQTVETKELAEEGHMAWRSILCKTNMNAATIGQIQRALDSRGYNPGRIDGVIGSETMSAVNAFQSDNGLPVDSYLNMETIRALGVTPQ